LGVVYVCWDKWPMKKGLIAALKRRSFTVGHAYRNRSRS
jgi:hypothetical protein